MTSTDVDIVTLVRDGDREAFGVLIKRYDKPVFNVALRMVSCPDDAADITQDVFVKAFTRLEQFNPVYSFFSWIYRIAVNESLNCLKSRERRRRPVAVSASGPRTPEEEYRRSESANHIQQVLDRLPPDHRIVIVLKHTMQMSYREMAETLGIPEKTVKSRLFSARREFREKYVKLGYAR